MDPSRIRDARRMAGLSQASLANLLGLSRQAYRRLEQGLDAPSSGQLLQLAQACGVRSEFFFRERRVELEEVRFLRARNSELQW